MSYAIALLSAVCSGFGTVLAATAARRSSSSSQLDPHLLLRLVQQVPFLASMGLSVVGLTTAAIALRELPLFTAQAVFASSVAVSAVAAAVWHGERLTLEVRLGVGAIVIGLSLLGMASKGQAVPDTEWSFRFAVLAAVIASIGLAAAMARRPGRSGVDVGLLGACAGLLYGLGSVGLRLIPSYQPRELITEPAAWAALLAGTTAILTIATALQRGSVARAAGARTVAETLVPTAIGLVLLGEGARPGWAVGAAGGFALAVAGAIVLCRDVEVPEPSPAP